MEMHQVRYFLAVARVLNFTRAADECFVTQPSLTRAIQKLEEELGGPLFRRERALTHLTDLGRLMLPHLERTYEAAQAAKALAKGVGRAEVAPLRLGVADGLLAPPLADALADVSAGLPGFDVAIVSGSSEALVASALTGELDLIVVEGGGDAPERFEHWRLRALPYCVLVGEACGLGPEVALDALAGLGVIEGGGSGAARLLAAAGEAGVQLSVRHRAASAAAAAMMASAGLGAAIVPSGLPPPHGTRELTVTGLDLAGEVVIGAIAGRKRPIAADAFLRAARARDWG
jgi:DNA-binding transcriptional LysR family regulator